MHYDCRPHPYVFFNHDQATATFVGFSISKETAELIIPGGDKNMVIPKDLMETLLYKLEMFDEGYREW